MTKIQTYYYRVDDCHNNYFYVVKSRRGVAYQTVIAKCPSKDYTDEIVEALNAKP